MEISHSAGSSEIQLSLAMERDRSASYSIMVAQRAASAEKKHLASSAKSSGIDKLMAIGLIEYGVGYFRL
jgi:hypothetical protein